MEPITLNHLCTHKILAVFPIILSYFVFRSKQFPFLLILVASIILISAAVTFIPRLHDTTGCQTGCQTGLTTGCQTVVQPV